MNTLAKEGKLQQLLQQIQQESGGDLGAQLDEGKLQQLLRQIQPDSGGKQTRVPTGGEEVTPQAGFVVKTTDQDNHKVFINICGSDKVPMAGGWADGKIPDEARAFLESTSMSESQQHLEALKLPLSLGETKLEVDKQGEPCTVYDVVFNDAALKQAKVFRHFKVFVITLSMGWIQQQKKTTLDAKYKLPKMPYKGDRISTQIMRIQQKSLVTEMQDMVEEPEFPLLTKRRPITVPGPPKGTTVRPDSAQAATSSSQPQQSQDVSSSQQTSRASTSMPATSRQQSNNSGKTYGHAELTSEVEYIGRPVEQILVTVDLPVTIPAQQQANAVAEVAGDHVHIHLPRYSPLDIHLPFAVSAEGATAAFANGDSQFCLKLPYLPCRIYIFQLRTSKKQRVELTDLSYDSYLELEP